MNYRRKRTKRQSVAKNTGLIFKIGNNTSGQDNRKKVALSRMGAE